MNLSARFLAEATPAAQEPGILFVAIMSIFIVMIGLACIIVLCTLMSKICQRLVKPESAAQKAAPAPAASKAAPAPIPNKGELIAAVTAAVAEELGTDVSAIRVLSFRRVGDTAPASAPIPNKGEMVAAVSAALAEELGTDISALRIHSIRKLN